MSVVHCPNCPEIASDAPLAFRTRDYNRNITEEKFDYYCCDNCGLVFLFPVPADIGRYYPRDYYAIPKDRAELRAVAVQWQQWKLDLVRKFKSGGQLLEIGPAYGLFASLAKDAGFDVTVIEMDDSCCRFLRDTLGVQVVQNSDTVAALQTLSRFDVITIWQVIEHLQKPWEVLRAAADHLTPGGIIVVDTPNPRAFQFGVLGKYWTHVDAPRHLTLIPASVLIDHAREIGLLVKSLSAADISANGFNGFGWAVTMKNFVGDGLFGKVVHLFGRALAKLLIPIERTGFRGSTYTVIFQKPHDT